jgi:hypothetical protein
MTLTLLAAAQFSGLLISFLYIVLVLAIIGGLIYCIEAFVSPIPGPIKLVFAIILLILLVIWALRNFGGGL